MTVHPTAEFDHLTRADLEHAEATEAALIAGERDLRTVRRADEAALAGTP